MNEKMGWLNASQSTTVIVINNNNNNDDDDIDEWKASHLNAQCVLHFLSLFIASFFLDSFYLFVHFCMRPKILYVFYGQVDLVSSRISIPFEFIEHTLSDWMAFNKIYVNSFFII